MSVLSTLNLDPSRYARHSLHGDSAVWLEKNCYIDVWIEIVHAAGLDPAAMLPCTLASDFDGDQWTFYKPSHDDLTALYGLSVQELNVWRPILQHALYHVGEGRLVLTEADSFYLPDTSGTDYRTNHVKSTIAIETIDLARRRLGYFHNAGYFQLEGEDFVRLLRVDAAPDPLFLPLFAELVKLDRIERLDAAALAERSRASLARWLPRRPRTNPLRRFAARFGADIEGLKKEGLATYHAYAFATIRQCGSSFELAAEYCRWLERDRPAGYGAASAGFDVIANGAKTMILKAARAVGGNKTIDFGPMIEEMAQGWDAAMAALDSSASS